MAKKTVKANPNAGTSIAKWDDELAKYAQEGAAQEQMPGGNFISFKGGVLQIAKKPIPGNKLDVIIVGNLYENTYRPGKYDPDNPGSPACFAFSRDGEDMHAHELSVKPQNIQEKEVDDKIVKASPCLGCPQNAWGTADDGDGKGKACKNGRRLALLSADDLNPESITNGEVLYARLSPLNVKPWALYVKGLNATAKRPAWSVVTRLSLVPDPKSQFRVVLEMVQPVDDGLLSHLHARHKAVMEEISFPYQASAENDNVKAKKGIDKSKPKRKKF